MVPRSVWGGLLQAPHAESTPFPMGSTAAAWEASPLPVGNVDDVTGTKVLLLHLAGQIKGRHGNQVGVIGINMGLTEELVVNGTGGGNGNGAHPKFDTCK